MQNSLDVLEIPASKGELLRMAQRDATRNSQVSSRETSRSASLANEIS